MSAISTPRTRVVLPFAIVGAFALALLLLLALYGPRVSLERSMTAGLLIACMVIFSVGGVLFTGRAFWRWPTSDTQRYLRLERGFVMSAVVVTCLGLALLHALLHDAGDSVFALLGLVTYLIGAVVVLVAETAALSGSAWANTQIILYVVLAFLGQAAFGAALLRTGLLPAWVGWATVLWNAGWLALLSILRPRDIYYPALHHVAPLVIGIALLTL